MFKAFRASAMSLESGVILLMSLFGLKLSSKVVAF